MSRSKTLLSLILLAFSNLAGCSSLDEKSIEPNKEFIVLFKNELENRALARIITKNLSSEITDERQPFWEAYSRLEEESYARLYPIAKEYHLSAEPTFYIESKAFLSKVAFNIFPKKMEEKLHKAIEAYLPELRILEKQSPTEHQLTFSWVVAQEQAQYDAFYWAIKGNYSKAAELLDNARFLEKKH